MTSTRLFGSVLVFAIVVGTMADRPRPHDALMLGGYRVLQVDFHTHSSMWSDASVSPFGLVLEARQQGLDAIAITGHNQVADSYLGRWFSRLIGGPTIIIGQEILTIERHTIAAGIRSTIDFHLNATDTIAEVHRQGGIAIAAHPTASMTGWSDDAVARLDGAEICHPLVYATEWGQTELEQFRARGSMAAIGSSDYHGMGPMGVCRTYVFATANSEQAILDGVRAQRTVVYGPNRRVYGDPALIALAADDGRLKESIPSNARGPLDWISGVSGLLALAGLVAFGREA